MPINYHHKYNFNTAPAEYLDCTDPILAKLAYPSSGAYQKCLTQSGGFPFFYFLSNYPVPAKMIFAKTQSSLTTALPVYAARR
jgi:hypothetical protein